MRAEHNFEGKYHSVQRMVRRLDAREEPPFRRIEREPGAEAQADFGRGAPIIGPDGKRRHSHVLRVSLSFSRKVLTNVSSAPLLMIVVPQIACISFRRETISPR